MLMCRDLTKDQMDRTLRFFASLGDPSLLQGIDVQEWSGGGFAALRDAPEHGDAFVCCILSHGGRAGISGTDGESLHMGDMLEPFKATPWSRLAGKPKVFLVQSCRGSGTQRGVRLDDLQTDESEPLSVPEEADFFVATATVEGYESIRSRTKGSWFIQSVCQQLKEGCPR